VYYGINDQNRMEDHVSMDIETKNRVSVGDALRHVNDLFID
jgi:hypothetical protein